MLYGSDLSHIHHTGFGTLAERASSWLLALLRGSGMESGLIVDLACGSGIWAARASAAGFKVLGIDVSAAMIDLARATAPDASFIVASAHSVQIPNCVGVTALGEGITYLADDAEELDLAPLVARVGEALLPGGVFVFDVVEARPDRPMQYVSTRHGEDWSVRVDVREDPARRMLTRIIDVQRRVGEETRQSVETHRVRTFHREEVLDLLGSAGLSANVTRAYGSDELPPQRIGFVAWNRRR